MPVQNLLDSNSLSVMTGVTFLVQSVSVLLVAEEPVATVPVLHAASLPVAAGGVRPVTFPHAAVVVREIVLVVRVEVGGEDVGVPAGVRATDEHVRVLAGVAVSPAGPGTLPTPLLGVTNVFTEPLQPQWSAPEVRESHKHKMTCAERIII